jgi:hypothetical protein
MSPDRVIYSFVLGWVVLIAVLIALDWLGNPNRGAFRPKGERPPRDRLTRREERSRRRLENDASVRAALRDAYGASSLRLTWTGDHETRARQLDDALVVEPLDGSLEVASRDITAIDRTLAIGDPLPNLTELPPEEPATDDATDPDDDSAPSEAAAPVDGADADPSEPESADIADSPDDDPAPPEPAVRSRGWRVGGDALALTAKGDEPAPATIRTRVWKNHGASAGWSDENRQLLRAGKAPRRVNPVTGRSERAIVDVETGRASWGSEPVDPFGGDR